MKTSEVLWISDSVYQRMTTEAEKWSPYETGGVFMGYQAENNDLVVTDLIDSGNKAKHRKFSFYPDQEYQLEQIARIYQNANGTITYLGDWHTHPNSKPDLSLLDKRTLTKIALLPESKNTQPIMAILGGIPTKWTLNTVQFISGSSKPWPFSKCVFKTIKYTIYTQ